MEEARQVLERLRRIGALERRPWAEIEALAAEGERWAAAEGDERARRAAAALRSRVTKP